MFLLFLLNDFSFHIALSFDIISLLNYFGARDDSEPEEKGIFIGKQF